jgi:hypothetical protein
VRTVRAEKKRAHKKLHRRASESRRFCFEPLERRYVMDGGLALTEIMYNPAPPQTGTADDFEFIELKNITAAPIQLGGMQLMESTTPGSAYGISYTFGQQLLQPGAYVVVARNLAAFQSKYGAGINVVGPFTGALGNGGERLVMQDAQGGTIFDFEYDDGWKPSTDGDGKSLVLLDELMPEAEYGEAGSWDASISLNGSPGRNETGVVINEIMSHTDATIGDWIELHNTSSAAINIGNWYLSDDEGTPNKFRIPAGTVVPAGGYVTFTQMAEFDNPTHPGALVPFGLSELGEEVVLTQSDAAGNLGAYQVVTSFGAFDREVSFGRHEMSTGETAFPALASTTFGAANSAPRVEAVVINELMFEPALGGDEFIEIRNLFQIPVALHDPASPANVWRFDNGVTFDFPAGTTLAANGYALVAQLDPTQFRTKYSIPASVPIFGPYTGSLNNAGEELSLVRPGEPELDGTVPYYVADIVDYLPSVPWPIGAAGTGATLSRANPLGYGEDPVNWATGPVGGTPGAANSMPTPGPSNLVATPTAANRIRLTWTDGVTGETGFRIERSTNGVDFVEAGIAAANATSFEDVRLQSARQYTYRVRALAEGGPGPPSNVASATTLPLTIVAGGSGADTIHVVRAGSQIHVFVNENPAGQPTFLSEIAAMTQALSIEALGGNDTLRVNSGGQAELGIGRINFQAGAGTNSLFVESGGARVESTANNGTLDTTVLSGARLSTSRLVQNGLNVVAGGTVTLLTGGGTSVLSSLTVGAAATLDITDNALIINYTGASPVATVRAGILSGRGGPGLGASWTGMGITSSTAAQTNTSEPESRAVGYAENSALPLGPYTTFRGQAVDTTSVLIAYTRTADANLDGLVNDNDVTVVGATFAPTTAQAQWALGDFDYNGFVADDDVTLLGVFYQPVAGAAVPVVALSPDHATASTASLPSGRNGLETFGQDDVRGQAFDELGRAETRAHQGQETRAQPSKDEALVDLLADYFAVEWTERESKLGDAGQSARRKIVLAPLELT